MHSQLGLGLSQPITTEKGFKVTNRIEAGPSAAFIGIKLDGTVLET